MLLTGSLLIIGACLDRIHAMSRPLEYRLVNHRKRCIRLNIVCYVISWLYAFVAHCLGEPPRTVYWMERYSYNSSRDVVCLRSAYDLKACHSDPDFPVRFWYSKDNALLSCYSHWGLMSEDSDTLPFAPKVNLVLATVLAILNLVLIRLFVRQKAVVGLSDTANQQRKKHELSVSLALIIESALVALGSVPGIIQGIFFGRSVENNYSQQLAATTAIWFFGLTPQIASTLPIMLTTSKSFAREFYLLTPLLVRLKPSFCHRTVFLCLVTLCSASLACGSVWLLRFAIYGHLACF